MKAGQVLATYTLHKEPLPWDTSWYDIPEARPRCRVRLVSDEATVSVLQYSGSEPELHILSGDVEISVYDEVDHNGDPKYREIKDEVRQ